MSQWERLRHPGCRPSSNRIGCREYNRRYPGAAACPICSPIISTAADPSIYDIATKSARAPKARCRSPRSCSATRPSGDLFGWSQDVGMGWNPRELDRPRVPDPEHARAACARPTARRSRWAITPGTGRSACSCRRRPRSCSGCGVRPVRRHASPTPATAGRRARPGMMDSLPYRNDAAIVFRRLIRSLPTRKGVLGVATCDKGLPAMMMALAGDARPAVRARARRRDAAADARARTPARSRSIGARFAHGELTLEEAAELGCRACAVARRRLPVPRHGGHVAGRRPRRSG